LTDHFGHLSAYGEPEDPFFVAHEAEFVRARVVRKRVYTVPSATADPDANRAGDASRVSAPRGGRAEPVRRDKVHPYLRRRLLDHDPDEREQLVVTFVDQPTVPRFPEPAMDEPDDSPRNAAVLERARALVVAISRQRASRYRELIAELTTDEPEITIVDRSWLVSCVLVEAPLRAVDRMSALASVLSVDPRIARETPPTTRAIERGRARIGSDEYFDLGLPGTWTAMLDTGVRRTHILLSDPSHIRLWRDCVEGGADCNTGVGLNPDDVDEHGTATAAILTGNNARGDRSRGVTAAQLDCFRVYYRSAGETILDHWAVKRGFQVAVAKGAKVIVAEMQGQHDHLGDLANYANAAFDSGAVVIAANGNTVGTATAASPACAQRVIGVGSVDVVSSGREPNQSSGPTGDGRIKPDVEGPTNTVSASSTSDSAMAVFDGTSGATPYVGGAAALIRSWLVDAGGTFDPGQVYVQLILFGQRVSPINNDFGAGRLRLDGDGVCYWGKVAVGDREVVDVPITVATAAQRLNAAIWCREGGPPIVHNTVTLSIVDPSGLAPALGASSTPGSVFERCRTAAGVATGKWSVRIRGANVPKLPQTVYWAAFLEL
jgi:serine protease AprX